MNDSDSGSRVDRAERLIWIDLEMSGLDPDADVILEAAVIVTDAALTTVAEWAPWVLYQPEAILENMDAWNTRTHTQSGLVGRCRASSLTAAGVERMIIKALKKVVDKKASPMCGNSICQDRRFLARHMPELEAYFHYRNFDVSSFKIAAQLYYPEVAAEVKGQKPSCHQALDDIRASIDELRFYRDRIFKARE